ncbi:MFS transporter [Halanaerobiaceae bacterium Z-7014]|uniref:MFS transporter n=1 Tax=Halonatronomonas betaini TaxID=2778430 RepID=A0A931AWH3_9FIRM|nr:MFS transporter [Halonatronomonas betaini]MBF8437356.1 MFS transporter [Halonatronomonas betaini]
MDTEQGFIPDYIIILVLIMGSFGVMGGGLIAPALPAIAEAFQVSEGNIGLVLSLYTFAAAVSLPFIGYFLDKIGRRKVGLTCLFIDGIGGLVIILAPNYAILLIMRFLQGIGIAGLIPVAMTIFKDLFVGDEKLKLMGYLTGAISIGAVIIPSLGGFLASIDWRFVFAVYGLSLILGLIFLFKLPETSPLINSNSGDQVNSEIENSPLEYFKSLLDIFKISKIRNIMIHSLTIYFMLYALITFLPIYLVTGHGFSEFFSGLAISLQGLFSAILSSRASFIAKYLNWRQRSTLGYLLIGICFILLPFWPNSSYLVSLSFIIYGAGMGIVSPTIYNRATELPPPEISGLVISVFNTMKFIGMTLSPFLLGLILIFTELEAIFIGVGIMAFSWGFYTLKGYKKE